MWTEAEHLGGRVGRGGGGVEMVCSVHRLLDCALPAPPCGSRSRGYRLHFTLLDPHHQANKRQIWRLHPGPWGSQSGPAHQRSRVSGLRFKTPEHYLTWDCVCSVCFASYEALRNCEPLWHFGSF